MRHKNGRKKKQYFQSLAGFHQTHTSNTLLLFFFFAHKQLDFVFVFVVSSFASHQSNHKNTKDLFMPTAAYSQISHCLYKHILYASIYCLALWLMVSLYPIHDLHENSRVCCKMAFV